MGGRARGAGSLQEARPFPEGPKVLNGKMMVKASARAHIRIRRLLDRIRRTGRI